MTGTKRKLTGKQAYSISLSNIFYQEIIVKNMPITFVKNKYFKDLDAMDWSIFFQLYILWKSVQESYAEINRRTFAMMSARQELDLVLKFQNYYNMLMTSLKDLENPDKWYSNTNRLTTPKDSKYYQVQYEDVFDDNTGDFIGPAYMLSGGHKPYIVPRALYIPNEQFILIDEGMYKRLNEIQMFL